MATSSIPKKQESETVPPPENTLKFDIASDDDDDNDYITTTFSDYGSDYESDDDGIHIMTLEEANRYTKTVTESEGFDLEVFPPNVFGIGLIHPAPMEGYLEGYQHFSKLAVEQFNKNVENANIQFEKIVKVNIEPAHPVNLYITFEAKDAAVDGVVNSYQTKVCIMLPLTNTFVDFVRLKPGSNK